MPDYPWTTLAVVAALLTYFWTSAEVGRARTKYGVAAPATSGHPEFDRRFRVQMNTLETLALFLPLLLLAAPVLGDRITAIIAILYPIGRVLYARAYYSDPASRSLGFGLTMLPVAVFLVTAIWGAVRTLL